MVPGKQFRIARAFDEIFNAPRALVIVALSLGKCGKDKCERDTNVQSILRHENVTNSLLAIPSVFMLLLVPPSLQPSVPSLPPNPTLFPFHLSFSVFPLLRNDVMQMNVFTLFFYLSLIYVIPLSDFVVESICIRLWRRVFELISIKIGIKLSH
jgi:hypothetical protein